MTLLKLCTACQKATHIVHWAIIYHSFPTIMILSQNGHFGRPRTSLCVRASQPKSMCPNCVVTSKISSVVFAQEEAVDMFSCQCVNFTIACMFLPFLTHDLIGFLQFTSICSNFFTLFTFTIFFLFFNFDF